jgi:hypothetical protein
MLALLSVPVPSAAADPGTSGPDLRSTLTRLVAASDPDVGAVEAAARVDELLASLDADQQEVVATALDRLTVVARLPDVVEVSKSRPQLETVVGSGGDLETFRYEFLSLLGRFRELSVLLDDPEWSYRLGEIELLIEALPPEVLPELHERYLVAAPLWKQALLDPDPTARADASAKILGGCNRSCGDDDGDCGVDVGCWICLLDEALCQVGEYATTIGNFVDDFFDDVGVVFTDIAALPAEIETFFVGLVSDIENELVGLVTDALDAIPDSADEALALLGLDNPDWDGLLASAPLIDLPCPPIGTEVPGIGTMGSIQAEYTCKRGIDWAAGLIYDVVPDDIYDIPIKAAATAVYYPINYFCLCVEAQSNIAFFGDQAMHRDLVEARMDAVLSTRSSQASVNALNGSLADLDGDVAVVEAKLDVLEVKLDGLQLSQNQNSDTLALFRELVLRLNIEEHLLEHSNDFIVLFQRPESQGGYLEEVRYIVADTIAMNTAAGERTYRALGELNDGDASYAGGDWAGAFEHYRRAYEQAVKR